MPRLVRIVVANVDDRVADFGVDRLLIVAGCASGLRRRPLRFELLQYRVHVDALLHRRHVYTIRLRADAIPSVVDRHIHVARQTASLALSRRHRRVRVLALSRALRLIATRISVQRII